jgi:subtilisin family serine protease
MPRFLRWSAPLLVLAFAACQVDSPTSQGVDVSEVNLAPAAGLPAQAAHGRPVPDQYIVLLRPGSEDPAVAATRTGGEVLHVYRNAVRGFAVRIPAAAAEALGRNPQVLLVEQDQVVTTGSTTQSGATWGLDRIDQRDLPLNSSYTYASTGSGVRAYIIDTGIRAAHTDFGGRVISGATAISDGGGTADCNGHGTHVAGTVGGGVWGVAKGVSLVPVRVLGCDGSGTLSGVIAGVDWVRGQSHRPAVANMSLGSGASSSLDTAVKNAIAAGITFVVAAGNSNVNACNYSPARVPEAITVGATTSTDARASYSNIGSCLDLFAPGSGITSAWHTSNSATNTISGTSMASPHVAGVAALVLAGSPSLTPDQVSSAIVAAATTGKVTSPGRNSPNRLLFSDGGTLAPPPPPAENQAPTASFTFSCTGLTCSFNGTGSSDSDGSIASYAWDFGDGGTATGSTASRTYASAGTHTVTLTVTDNGGLTGTTTRSVTTTAPSSNLTLAATVRTASRRSYADLVWSGNTSNVDIYLNGSRIARNVSGTTYTRDLGRGSGTASFRVCHTGSTATCSPTVSVTYPN